MKKIIGASIALLVLTSCGAPTVESPADALQKNQVALLENIEKLQKLTPEQAKSVGSATIEIAAKEGKVHGAIEYDFQVDQTNYETAGNIKMNMSLDANDPIMAPMNMSGGLNIDMITLKNKVLFKLNSLEVKSDDPNNQVAALSAMTAAFQKNWYFIDNTAQNPLMVMQQELLTKQKEIVSLIKKHTLLSHISTNENADFYDYDVQLNQEGVLNFMKDLEILGKNENNTGSLLTQSKIDNIKESVDRFNAEIKGNIKIDKSNLEYFILTFTNKDGSITIQNSKKNFNIILADTIEKVTISLLGTKSRTSFDAVISVVGEKSETETINLVDGNMKIQINGEKSNIHLDMIMKDESSDEELKINVVISDTTKAETIKITEPADAKNFEEVLMQILGPFMGNPAQMNVEYDEIETKNNPEILPTTPAVQ